VRRPHVRPPRHRNPQRAVRTAFQGVERRAHSAGGVPGRSQEAAPLGWPTLLVRGARRRCPACGTRGLFTRWVRMAERCPGCGMRFEREEGFFLGVYFMNITLTQIVLMAYVAVAFVLTLPDPPMVAVLAGAAVVCTVVPVVAYPACRTLWTAVHLGMQPLEPAEQADAAAFRFERGDATPPPAG
jgi:uncharacterized protein (DUF983 family)